MLHQIAYLTTATLAFLATSASAAPLGNGSRVLTPRAVDSSLTAAARVLAGDQCPTSSGGSVNAHVLVAVKIHEVATLTLKTDVVTDALGNIVGGILGSASGPQPARRAFLGDIASGISALTGMNSPAAKPGSSHPDNLPVDTPLKAGPGDVIQLAGGAVGAVKAGVGAALDGSADVKANLLPVALPPPGPVTLPGIPSSSDVNLKAGLSASVELDLQVCLCLDAQVTVGNLPVSAAVKAQAEADLALYAKASTNVVLNTLGGLLDTAGLVDVSLSLTPMERTICGQCSISQYPTCTGGKCGCAECPGGKKYDAASNSCILTPSAGSKLRARSIPGYWTPKLIQGKQAKREDIVKRLAAKSATKTS